MDKLQRSLCPLGSRGVLWLPSELPASVGALALVSFNLRRGTGTAGDISVCGVPSGYQAGEVLKDDEGPGKLELKDRGSHGMSQTSSEDMGSSPSPPTFYLYDLWASHFFSLHLTSKMV